MGEAARGRQHLRGGPPASSAPRRRSTPFADTSRVPVAALASPRTISWIAAFRASRATPTAMPRISSLVRPTSPIAATAFRVSPWIRPI